MLAQIYHHYQRCATIRAIEKVKRLGPVDPAELTLSCWPASLSDPLAFYLKCARFFHNELPDAVRQHREYFCSDGRGFGEDAFHAMWFLLHREFNFRRFLEIGVYRGQVLSLISLLQQMNGIDGVVAGVSPFCKADDAVSRYRKDIDYLNDTLTNFHAFSLTAPLLLRAYSTDPESVKMITSQVWDCIYIDGNHDYDVVSLDWVNSSKALRQGGLIVLDDSALSTAFVSPRFATKGHPGPSRVAAEVDRHLFKEILQVGHNRVFQKLL